MREAGSRKSEEWYAERERSANTYRLLKHMFFNHEQARAWNTHSLDELHLPSMGKTTLHSSRCQLYDITGRLSETVIQVGLDGFSLI